MALKNSNLILIGLFKEVLKENNKLLKNETATF